MDSPAIIHLRRFLLTPILLLTIACSVPESDTVLYRSDSLVIEQITANTYVHTSFLQLTDGDFFPCNGLVYAVDGEAVVFDTPTTDSVSSELMGWVTDVLNARIKAVVINHFHIDCLGGLKTFHDEDIPSYAHVFSANLRTKGTEDPQNLFESQLILPIGNNRVINRYIGAAHTRDNIVSYIEGEAVLFGGCMVKSVGASKGNLADADTIAWPVTVSSIAAMFDQAEWVVPGHGKPGGRDLLEYTVRLFE